MPPSNRPAVHCNSVNPGFIVSDLDAAIQFYTGRLGFTVSFTWGEPPRFAGLSLDNVSIHLMTGEGKAGEGMAYFGVEDADALYRFHREQGVTVVEPIADREYNMRDYSVTDLDGNRLGFGHYLFSRTPELKIERVDVPVRLEKRLAAVLKDLAHLKGMDINSTLEETLLHTFEPLGDGVASPHTPGQLQAIQELKKQHGIDYDVHASYRFVE